MVRAPDDPQSPASDDGPSPSPGEATRFVISGERPYQKLRRLEQEGNVARWTFFGGLRASTRSETVTTILLAANCAVFAAMVTWGVGFLDPSPESLLTWGALRPLLTRDGQPWRLLTACFLHVGIIHLAVNMFSLWSMRFVEHWFGHLSFAVLYVVSGLCGSLASTAFSDPFVVGAGASGALFGILGAVLGAALRWKRLGVDSRVTGPILKGVFNTILINGLIAASIRNLDHFAHAGGFVSGIVLGYALAHAPTSEAVAGRRRRGYAVAAASCVALVAMVLALRRPGLAAAGERVDLERTDEPHMVSVLEAFGSDVPPGALDEMESDWLPYVTAREKEMRDIAAAHPEIGKQAEERRRWYARLRLSMEVRVRGAGRPTSPVTPK